MKRHESSLHSGVARDRFLEIPVDKSVRLRLVTLVDAKRVHDLAQANLKFLSPWVGWANESFDIAASEAFIRHNLEEYDAGYAYAMGIYEDDVLRGVVDIRGLSDSPYESEVGYWLAGSVQGRGLATRATRALIDYACNHHKIHRLVLHTYVRNEASSRVAGRLGFAFKGIITLVDGRRERRYEKLID